MYEIKKNGKHLSYEDVIRYVKLQSNGIYCLCSDDEAAGIVVNNGYICHLAGRAELPDVETVSFDEINGANKINRMNTAGAEAMQSLNAEPPVSAGVFTYGEWQPDTQYEQYALFTYNGMAGFVRQAHTSLAVYPPFSTGTEALYGARPSPDVNGIYPYVYNMKVEVGMKVRSEKDGNVYIAIQPADPLLYDPADVPALFDKI